MSLEQLLAQYGYFALLLGTLLEGETIVIIAGFLADRGYLELRWVIVVAFAGTLVADQFFFHLGRRGGLKALQRRPTWEARLSKVRPLVQRHQTWAILGFRFLYGLRTVTPFALGTMGIRPRRFFVLNALGAAVWATVFSVLGYLLGSTLELVIERVHRYEMVVVVALAIAGAAAGILLWRRQGRRDLPQ